MLSPVPFTHVRLSDDFWRPRLEINRTVTIPACFERCRETGRIDNFAKAAGRLDGPHAGQRYDDSDVFKVIEGAAYSLAVHPDPTLRGFVEGLVELIAAAQEPDGYLFTARTIDPAHPAEACGAERFSYLAHSHELYNAGHLYEAAAAWFQATGRRDLLDVALRNAELIDREFGPGRRPDPPGHEEIEIGLVKLHRVTGEDRYLRLAKFFLDARGRSEGRALYGEYAQDHAPVAQQDQPVGHAVRATYLYSGMADVAALLGEKPYVAALDRIWENLVGTRLYLTGGIGARHSGEAFGDPWELPNESAYAETCAAIGNALWNHRMALLHGDARYADVLERVLYNGLVSGVSLEGDRFFYPNPLASSGSYHRSPWFSCACCPVNLARFIASVPGLLYAAGDAGIVVNLFAASTAQIALPGGTVKITQETSYPWDGRVAFRLDPPRAMTFALSLRVPGWAAGRPVPGDLYGYVPRDGDGPAFALALNGAALPAPQVARGYARIERAWKPGDTVTLELDMRPRLVRCDERVEANRGRLALERGPIVYCIEAADHGSRVRNLWMEPGASLRVSHRPDLLGGVTVIEAGAFALRRESPDGPIARAPATITAVPYFAWDHREPGEMTVWVPASPDLASPLPPPTIASAGRASASHCWEGDSAAAVNDQLDPESSGDRSVPRLTWWDHRGTTEWAQYDFDEPRWVRSASVYWFDDTGQGGCRVPESWRLLYRDGGAWRPVTAPSGYGTARDAWNRVDFDPVLTAALRLEVRLRPKHSGGVLEWRLE